MCASPPILPGFGASVYTRDTMLIPDGVRSWAEREPVRPAIEVGERRVTFGELREASRSVAAGVASRVDVGGYVAILLDDPARFLATFLGIVDAGCVAVPLSAAWSDEELSRVIEAARPALLITDREPVPGGVDVLPAGDATGGPAGPIRRVTSNDPFYVGFTSGSSGAPKGVVRNHLAWLSSFQLMTLEFGIGPDDRVVVPGSLFFSFSLIAALHALFAGARVVIPARRSTAGLLGTLRSTEGATLYALPSTLAELLRMAGRRRTHLAGVRRVITAGEKLEPVVRAAAGVALPNAALYEYYGASELGYVSLLRPGEQRSHPDSVGRPVVGAQVAILDDRGREVAHGTAGLLCGRTGYGFSGYLGDTRGVAAIDHYGWRTVGDLARQDDDGFLYLVGRRDNMVVIRGQNVYPEEAEAVLRDVPGVVAAVAVPEPADSPRRLVALVELSGRRVDAQTVLATLRGRLSGPRLPRRVVVVDRLPRTATGKVDRGAAVVLLRRSP